MAKIDDLERTILLQMSVYRRPIPADLWSEPPEQATLMRLTERQLVQHNRQGTVTLLPSYRQILYDTVPMEVKEALHIDAATVRALRGEFTAAAYHLTKSSRPAQAVRTWYPQRYLEIDQGQASAALHLFEGISLNQLTEQTDQELLSLIRGELQKLLGNYQQAQATLHAITWRTPRLSALARRLTGDIAELNGDLEAAKIVYEQGLSLIGDLLETELALFHRDMGWIQRRRKSLDEAWDEAQRAEHEVAYLKGHICRDRGQFTQAEAHYLQALQLAQELKIVDSEAKTRNALAAVMIKQGQFTAAEAHFQQAYQTFQRLGKVLSVASVSVNQAVACLLDERASDAIAYAEKARTIFEQIQHPYGIATAYQALAEAYLANGNLDDATIYAWKAVETEESAIIPDALRVIGEIYRERGAFDQAAHYLGQSLATAHENEDQYLAAYTLRALGKLDLEQANYQSAKAHFHRAIELFDEIGLGYEAARSRRLLPQNGANLP
ncbi:MAG: tetratricopeptide repeat protein [Phormidesmis sp. RL_2_1]|nr:tetratricopeptide repeat protein [Phormidesmis sp. RL_2_1]